MQVFLVLQGKGAEVLIWVIAVPQDLLVTTTEVGVDTKMAWRGSLIRNYKQKITRADAQHKKQQTTINRAKKPKSMSKTKQRALQEQASRELFVGAEPGEPWLSVQRLGF
jgi:hypothetical protein